MGYVEPFGGGFGFRPIDVANGDDVGALGGEVALGVEMVGGEEAAADQGNIGHGMSARNLVGRNEYHATVRLLGWINKLKREKCK